MSVRTELDALHAALFHMQQEFAKLRREQGIQSEEVYKRLVWYSHLEQLAIKALAWDAGKGSEEELREIVGQVRKVHRFVSPGVRSPGQEAEAEKQWRRPA